MQQLLFCLIYNFFLTVLFTILLIAFFVFYRMFSNVSVISLLSYRQLYYYNLLYRYNILCCKCQCVVITNNKDCHHVYKNCCVNSLSFIIYVVPYYKDKIDILIQQINDTVCHMAGVYTWQYFSNDGTYRLCSLTTTVNDFFWLLRLSSL